MKKKSMKMLLFVSAVAVCLSAQETSLIKSGDTWKYNDKGVDLGTSWKEVSYDDASWSSGASQLGYGDGDEASVVSYGGDKASRHITTYFRKTITIDDVSKFTSVLLEVLRDDGAVVYINGTEVARLNIADGPVSYSTLAGQEDRDDNNFYRFSPNPSVLADGKNVIAAEVHQSSASSSDLSFDLKLSADSSVKAKNVHFGSTKNPLEGVTITWQALGKNDSIKWGYSADYSEGAFAAVQKPGYNNDYLYHYTFNTLQPAKTLHYSIFDSRTGLWTPAGTLKTTRSNSGNEISFIVQGDCQSGNKEWNTMANRAAKEDVDFALDVGDRVLFLDNIPQWEKFFANGESFLEKNLIFNGYGNHDRGKFYEQIYTLPHKEYYYSFTHANALFVCLNSNDSLNSEQYEWLKKTLAVHSDAQWKILWFHHPFYTWGSHANEMNGCFATWWKEFDKYGVDMIFNGHSHHYHRTRPINREISTTSPVQQYGSEPGQGRCQVIAGNMGTYMYAVEPYHWFVAAAREELHYCRVDIDGATLKLQAIDQDGIAFDSLTIVKSDVGVIVKNEKISRIDNIDNRLLDNAEVLDAAGLNVSLYNARGRRIMGIGQGRSPDLCNGVYVVRIKANRQDISRRVLRLMK